MTGQNTTTFSSEALTVHYLTMRIGEDNFAIDMQQVIAILPLSPVTPLPHTPAYIKGVLSHHDDMIPVIDLRIWFQLGTSIESEETVIIVVKYGGETPYQRRMGLVVERVLENDIISASMVKAAPRLGQQADNKGITGLFSMQDTVVRMIDTNLLSRQALT